MAQLQARRVMRRGEPAWVFHNPATGKYWQASPRLYMLQAALDGRRTVAEALATLPDDPDESDEDLLAGLAGMTAAGLIVMPGGRRPPLPPGDALAPLRQLAFTRIRIGDLGRALPYAAPALGWLFTRGGVIALGLLILTAIVSIAGQGAELAEQWQRLANPDLATATLAYLVFIASKMLHETGHAVAVQRMAAAEGHRVQVVPWGVSFMFLMPAPYVDASATWFLQDRRRRAIVGLAGIATDLTVAALAAIAWSFVGPSILKDRLFDLILIAGASSLLFNLNPLVRLDGYYVLTDLLGIDNMQPRAQAALGRVFFGGASIDDAGPALYAAASWCYRWTVYLGITWGAAHIHWSLGLGVALVALTLVVIVPLWRGVKAPTGPLRRVPQRVARIAIGGAVALLALCVVPVPAWVEAEGVVQQTGLTLVYPRTDALVLAVARPGPTDGTPVLRLDNPESVRMLSQLGAEAESLAIEARRARSEDITKLDLPLLRGRAVADQIAALEKERAGFVTTPAAGLLWEPVRALTLPGEWVRRDDPRPLGALVGPGQAELRLVLDQWDGPRALAAIAARPDRPIPMRLRGFGPTSFTAQAAAPGREIRDTLPSPALSQAAGGRIPARPDNRGEARPIERAFELRLVPTGEAPPELRHGARVEAHIPLPWEPVALQLWRRAAQIVQRRLAT